MTGTATAPRRALPDPGKCHQNNLNHSFPANNRTDNTMPRTCARCGATMQADEAVFCNRCGSRLPPAAALACPACGRELLDPLSRFCDRCGLPFAGQDEVHEPEAPQPPMADETPEAEAEEIPLPPPARPKQKGQVCPACGFENEEKNRFYCRQCGAYIREKEGIRSNVGGVAGSRSAKGPIRIRQDGMDEIRKRPSFSPAPQERQPVARRKKGREPAMKKPLPYRKIAIGAVIVIALILIALVVPGMLKGEQKKNATATKSLAAHAPSAASAAGAAADSSPLDGIFSAIQGLIPTGGLFGNQAAPVVKDTSPVP